MTDLRETSARKISDRMVVGISLAIGAGMGIAAAFASGGLQLKAPRLELIAAAAPAIQIHVVAASLAFAIGAVLLLGPKGTTPHRTLGWIWAAAMGTTAVSSLFITELNDGVYSLIHLLSGWVIVLLPAALYAARRHKVKAHRAAMTGMYFGGMIVAGGFAFLPGRLMWEVFLA